MKQGREKEKALHQEEFQQEEGQSKASAPTPQEREARDPHPDHASEHAKAPASGGTSRSISRRALTAWLIAGGIGLGAGGIAVFLALRRQEPVSPAQPHAPGSLLFTYRGHVHDLPKGITFSDVFAFLAWVPQSRRILSILSQEFVSDKKLVASAQIWNAFDGTSTSTFLFPFAIQSDAIISVHLAPPEGGVYVVWNDAPKNMFHVTDITTNTDVFTSSSNHNEAPPFPCACSPDGRLLAYTIPQENNDSADAIKLRNLPKMHDLPSLVMLSSADARKLHPRGWSWSPDSQRLVSWYSDHTGILAVWQVETSQLQTRFLGHQEDAIDGYFLGLFTKVVWSPDNHQIASLAEEITTGNTWSLRVWNADTGHQIFTIKSQQKESMVDSVHWSPNSQMLAIIVRPISNDMKVQENTWSVLVWDTDAGHQLFTIDIQQHQWIEAIHWSPDSQMFALLLLDESTTKQTAHIEIWHAASKTRLVTKPITSSHVFAWTPDSKELLSSRLKDQNNTYLGEELELWDATTGRTKATYHDPTNRVAYSQFLAWSPDGQHVAAGISMGTETGAVQIWKIR